MARPGSIRKRSRASGRGWTRTLFSASLVALLLSGSMAAREVTAEPRRSLLLATTTSVRDSGLLDAILPEFRDKTDINVRVVAVGTGAALRMGREGNADVLLTHAPEAEEELVEAGIARKRVPFMENFFVIAGPAEDPAQIADLATPEEAIQAIAENRAPWVSRADDSGTFKREVALWKAAGLPIDSTWSGVLRTGSGMGLSLQVAGEKRAYILSDIGTFLAYESRIGLVALSKPASTLRNVYSILQLDETRFEHSLHSKEAQQFEDYLLSPSTLARISEFGTERFGRALFVPISDAFRQNAKVE